MRRLCERQSTMRCGILAGALALTLAIAACDAGSPSSPNSPTQLTGQNPNETASFSGTISIIGTSTVAADGQTDAIVTAVARDLQGNPVTNGTPFSFSTSLGTVRAAGTSSSGATGAVQLVSFGGEATVAVQSEFAGDATVVVWIADVSANTSVRFLATPALETISLALLNGSSAVQTLDSTAPADIPIRATVTDETGVGLPSRTVRFEIVKDTTARMARGTANLLGSKKTETNSAGEAHNVLSVRGTGSVVLEAELLQGNTVVGTSNQVVANITTRGSQVVIALAFDTGGIAQDVTIAGTTLGMIAEVTDKQTGEELGGRRVRFEIVEDTAATDPAELTTNGSIFTNGAGEAVNGLTLNELGSRVAVVAEVLDASGAVEAISNQIIASSVALDVVISLTFDTLTTFESDTSPVNLGLLAAILDRGNGVNLANERVQFLIVADTATTTVAALGNTLVSFTDSNGEATNSITATESSTRVTIVAEWLDAAGNVLQRSNQVVLAVE